MSYFSNALGQIMERRSYSKADVSRISGIPFSTVSRLLRHDFFISDEDLRRVGEVICENDEDRANLTAARMQDLGGPCKELVRVSVGDKPFALRDEPPASHPFENALRTIRAHHHIPEVQDVIIPLAALIATGELNPVTEEKRNPVRVVYPRPGQKPSRKRKPGDASASAKQT